MDAVKEAERGGRNGKKRSYGLTRVVHPDPRSRSENRGLERHGEPCAGDSMERGGVTALQGPLTQTRYLGARGGVWNDMRSAAWWKQWKEAELRLSAGRLPRSPISEREANLERHGETYMELRSFEGPRIV